MPGASTVTRLQTEQSVQYSFGHVRYLVFYLLAGYAATALQTVVTLSTAPESADIPNLGASGAISGVLGAYFLLLLDARKVLTLIFLGIIFFREDPPRRSSSSACTSPSSSGDAGFQFLHPPRAAAWPCC